MRRWFVLAMLLALLLPAGVASAGGGGSSCPGFGEGDTVTLLDNCFSATAQFVAEGTLLRAVNSGHLTHTYTAVDGSFDTGAIAPGESADVAVGPGVHRVYCTLHSSARGEGMSGVVVAGPVAGVAGRPVTDRAGLGPWAMGSATGLAAAALMAGVATWLTRRRSQGGVPERGVPG